MFNANMHSEILSMRLRISTKFVVLISLQLFGNGTVYAQNHEEIRQQAFRYYIAGKNDSALHYFRLAYSLAPPENKALNLYYLGSTAYNLNQLNDALHYLQACTQVPDTFRRISLSSPQREAALLLLDVCSQQENYKEVITWAKNIEERFNTRTGCSTGRYEDQMEITFKKARAYYYVGETDSAISILTPYMFSEEDQLILDSGIYQSYVQTYLRWLLEKHPDQRYLKQKIENTVNSIQVDLLTNDCEEDMNNGFTHVKAYTQFMGITLSLIDMSVPLNTWGGPDNHPFRNSVIQQHVRNGNLYRLLMSLPAAFE